MAANGRRTIVVRARPYVCVSPRLSAGRLPFHVVTTECPSRHHRYDRDRERERQQDRDSETRRERTKELADDAGQQAERHEDDHRRQRRAHQRCHQLLHRVGDGLVSFRRPPVDVLNHHHGIVNDQADGDGESTHRHQVDRTVEEPQEHERRDDRERQRRCGNQRQPDVAEEQNQDYHGEDAADENGVAHVGDCSADELGEVIDLGQPDA
jgi:hypothetical protein